MEMLFSDRTEELLNVSDGKQVFVVVDEQQQENVLLAVFFADRGRKQAVFGLVVDHGFGEGLVLRAALGLL